ncbi:MAG: hypothetical protein ACRCXX_14280 [Cetobacterium sp.]|uniref:hypothetical protein n=1 Tax=Cetobacterium sp. TaxID=2071632 RepID=UPI003F37146E
MFLENYKKFKKTLKEEFLFEDKSIGDNPLFAFVDSFAEDFDNFIQVDDIRNYNSEIEKTISKLLYIEGFLEHYKNILIEESQVLDEEINLINNTQSFKGASFLDLKDRMLDYNYVFDVETVHSKNMKTVGDNIFKVEENSVKVDGFFSYPDLDKIIFNIKKPSMVNDLIIDTYKEMTISIYGENEDGETKPLFINASSSQRLFINTVEENFTKIILISNGNLKSYIKNINIYYKEFATIDSKKTGFIFTKIKNNNIKNILISSDNETEMFMLSKTDFDLSIKEIFDNEKYVVDKFLVEKNKIEKNKPMLFDNINSEFYFIEKIDKDINNISINKIFGKE